MRLAERSWICTQRNCESSNASDYRREPQDRYHLSFKHVEPVAWLEGQQIGERSEVETHRENRYDHRLTPRDQGIWDWEQEPFEWTVNREERSRNKKYLAWEKGEESWRICVNCYSKRECVQNISRSLSAKQITLAKGQYSGYESKADIKCSSIQYTFSEVAEGQHSDSVSRAE